MRPHHHSENFWRVRVDDENGTPRGAGVLLDDRHVLTCAHVVRYAGAEPGGPAARVRISSVACRPEWSRTARVAPRSWVHQHDTRRGDVALLELDEPAGCGSRTTMWRAPISGGRVRVYGFPQAEPFGIATEAELAGSGGRQGEWGLLNQVHAGGPWIEEGFSGAGVMALGGEFDGRLIGIVVADYVDAGARAAWMLPTETVQAYLPQIGRFVDGGRSNDLDRSGGRWPDDVLGDSLRLALTQELTRLLDGGWSGTVVVGTGGATGAGASWLLRLVGTADPAARATVSDAELTGAPGDTVLGLGAIDAACDARGKSVADVRNYLVDRFGLRGGDDREVVRQLLRRDPPACLVVGSADRAEDADALMRTLLGPLAARARSRGIRLVLGFEGRPPPDLAHEVSLESEPLTGAGLALLGRVTAEAAEAAVGRLAAEEEAAARLQTEWGLRFFAPPQLPPCWAPRLRVRLAVARGRARNVEVSAIHAQAVAARAPVARFDRALRRLIATREDLRTSLEVHRVRAARFFGDEDRRLGDLHAPAARALLAPPIDLVAARALVGRYADEVNRRIDEG